MSRPLRIEYENAIYHVMNRGRNRVSVFHSKIYYETFLRCIEDASQRFGMQVLAYCLMGNHYHLLIKTPRGNLSRCMRHVDGVYTQRYNKLRNTDGSLFRGRYKAILIEADNYLLPVSRYIHRNPIEMKKPLVKTLKEYKWSSYLAYVDQEPTPEWLVKADVLSLTNIPQPLKQITAYQRYVNSGNEPEIAHFYSQPRQSSILGSEKFKEEAKKLIVKFSKEISDRESRQVVSPSYIIQTIAKHYKLTPEQLLKTSRGAGRQNIPRMMAIYLSFMLSGESLERIAQAFNILHYSTVSQTVRRFKQLMSDDQHLQNEVNVKSQDLTP